MSPAPRHVTNSAGGGLGRESLYKALSTEGNPEFATVLKVMGALGVKLKVRVVSAVRPPALRFAQHPALGRKVSDEFTVPLCRGHHREVHRCGDEVGWWENAGVDPTVTARALWLETHPLPAISDTMEGTAPPAALGTDQKTRRG